MQLAPTCTAIIFVFLPMMFSSFVAKMIVFPYTVIILYYINQGMSSINLKFRNKKCIILKYIYYILPISLMANWRSLFHSKKNAPGAESPRGRVFVQYAKAGSVHRIGMEAGMAERGQSVYCGHIRRIQREIEHLRVFRNSALL